jgi:hypothetical protein
LKRLGELSVLNGEGEKSLDGFLWLSKMKVRTATFGEIKKDKLLTCPFIFEQSITRSVNYSG